MTDSPPHKADLKDWQPDKGMTAPGVYVHKVIGLSQAQCDKLAELSAPLGPTGRLLVQQTKSDPGGTHLYALVGDDEWHIARDGNAIKMGPVDRNSLEKSKIVESDEQQAARLREQDKRDQDRSDLAAARRAIDKYGPPPPGEGTHPLQRHRDSMG